LIFYRYDLIRYLLNYSHKVEYVFVCNQIYFDFDGMNGNIYSRKVKVDDCSLVSSAGLVLEFKSVEFDWIALKLFVILCIGDLNGKVFWLTLELIEFSLDLTLSFEHFVRLELNFRGQN
jgi:hypothetical protein